jgi:hypothetical protein
MRAFERRLVARLVDEAVRPTAPLPPVDHTDAVAAFDAWLGYGPAVNRVALRALVVASSLAPRRLEPARDVLRRIAARCYYGDDRVMRLLGYDADAIVALGAAVRVPEGRP